MARRAAAARSTTWSCRTTSRLATEFRNDLLGGVQVITGAARHIEQVDGSAGRRESSKQFPVAEELEFTAIPYYAWAHRGPGEMAVWLARTPKALNGVPGAER